MALVSTPAIDRELFKGALERFEDVPPSKRQKRALADSAEASRFVELDLINDDEEDEGEIMLLAMILLQIHGVKLPTVPVSPPDLDQNKKKRQRTSPEQLAILEQIFQTDKMPSQQTRIHLAEQLGMSSRRVQIWFQNKRAKVKRGLNKSTEFDDVSSPEDDVPSKLSVSSPDQQTPISPSFASLESAHLSSATLSTLHLLNSSSSLVPNISSPKSPIFPMKETTGSYASVKK